MRTELFKQVADQVGGFASVPNLTSLPAVSRSSQCTLSGSSARAPVSSIPDLSAWRSPRLCSGPSRHQPHQSGLTELRGRVAVKPEGPRKGGAGVWQDRVVTGCRGRNLGDAAHADRVMVAAGETGLTGGRAEPVVWNRLYRRPLAASFEVRRLAWTTKGAGRTKTDIVDEDEQDIRRARGRPQLPDRRILRVRVFGIVGRQTNAQLIRDRENGSLNLDLLRHRTALLRATQGRFGPPGTHPDVQVVRTGQFGGLCIFGRSFLNFAPAPHPRLTLATTVAR